MRFHNKNIYYGEEEMSGIQNGTIKDPTSWERSQMELFQDKKIGDLKNKVNEIKKPKEPIVPVIPYDQQMTFWNYLNDIQYGQFKPELMTKANTWLVTRAGSWLVQKNKSGYYGIKKSDLGIPTLPATVTLPEAFFELKYGKIPNAILQQIVTFFRDIMKKYNDAEAFVQVYWDLTENKYVCHVPKQRISKGSVNYDATENLDQTTPERYVFAYECHSHNSMGAFWSGTDDRDEKELRVYGVFGQLNKAEYANKHRFFVGEEQVDVDMSLVFDIPEVEKKYVVTWDKRQFIVKEDKLKLDEKPKYIYQDENGKEIYVPLENVTPFKGPESKTEYPDSWFKGINVPFASQPSAPRNLPAGPAWINKQNHPHKVDVNQYGMPIMGKKDKKPMGMDQDYLNGRDSSDPFYYIDVPPYDALNGQEGIDPDYEMTQWDISVAVDELLGLVTHFDDEEASYILMECLEAQKALKPLEQAIASYYIKSRQFEEQGPSDGKYNN